MPVETSLEEVRKLILSLLVARPDFTPLPVLDNDYYEAEGNRIPWRRFGFGSLLEFLQSMPQYFLLTYHNGVNCIRGISDKSKHVSSLVARQKKMPRCTPSRFHRSFYHTHVPRSRPKIPAEKLNYLVRYVNSCPNGIYINSALRLIQSQLPYIQLSTYDIQDQLRELGHQVYLDGDTIRPVIKNASALQTSLSRYHQSPLAASEPPVSKSGPSSSNIVYRQSPLAASESPVNKSEPSSSNIVYTVPEEYSDCDTDEDGFVRPNSRTTSLRQAKTNERLVSSLRKHSNYEETVNYHDHHDNQEEKHNNIDNVNYPVNLNMSENESNNLADLISRTMQMRLQLLIEKHPEGIPCSELPNLYMKEFKIPLNYTELGFNSVCTFASYLPDIFYLRRLNMNDDFVLYSANKRAKEQDMIGNDDQETSKSFAQGTTKPINIPNLRQLSDVNDDNAPFPLDLSPDMLDKFVPADVTTSDGISYILVTDLQQDKKQYLEVYIVEVFTPSFFWIHLRKNVKHFEKFMDELHQYYEQSREGYIIPKLALKRGLNCACTYNGYWHRAVIKNVKPDFRVTVMFYDYGTQKTYTSENVFYLAKRFCELPAQAIPCGLYNVKPYVGDRWKKSITDRFIDRISETLLAATVVSIDPPDNSMLIILTDTSEDEDVRINDWLVQENLARSGKMVRINRNFPFREYFERYVANVETTKSEDVVAIADTRNNTSKVRPLHVSSNAISENFLKNVKALNKVPEKKTDSNNSEKKNKPGSHRLARLVDFVKMRRFQLRSHEAHDSHEYLIQKDLEQTREKLKEHEKRDYNNETSYDEKYFGTFHSMYGGHGDIVPFDWSVIRPIDSPNVSSLHSNISDSNKATTSVNRERETSISPPILRYKYMHKVDDRTKLATSCVLNIASKEKEYFLTVGNMYHDDEDVSQSVARLRCRLQIQDDNSTELVIPREIHEKLRMYSTQILTCDAAPSSSIENTNIVESQVDESNKTRATKFIQEVENKDDDSEPVELSQDVHQSSLKDAFELNTEKSQHTPNYIFHNKYQMLQRTNDTKQYCNSSLTNRMKGWSSSDPDPSSYSSHSSTDETMHSSDDDQREALSRKNIMSRFNKLQSFATKSASRMSDSNESNVKTEDLTSDNDTDILYSKLCSFRDVLSPKLRRMSLVDDLRPSEVLKRVLKIQYERDTEQLDSDDSSDLEDSDNDSRLAQPEVDDALVVSDSVDDNAKMSIASVPVLDDCDIDSDSSTWDMYSGL